MAQFMIDHSAVIIEILAALFLVVVAIIALTKRKDDDEALLAFIDRLSPVQRKALGGGALAAVLALLAALVGGCGGNVPLPDASDSVAMARIVGCKACAAIGGDKGAACAAVLGCEP
jgi:hypothetical protein